MLGRRERESRATYESTGVDTVYYRPCKFVLSEIGKETLSTRIARLHDHTEQSLKMLHALLNGIDVTLGGPTLVAGAFK
jgi:hypothetical protein